MKIITQISGLLFGLLLFSCGQNQVQHTESEQAGTDSVQHHIKTGPMQEEFAFELTLSRKEQSKDSNGRTEKYVLSGLALDKTYSYSGRKPKEPKTQESIKISTALRDRLKAAMFDSELKTPYEKTYSEAPEDGFRVHYTATLKGKDFNISISGGKEQMDDLTAQKLQNLAIILDKILQEKELGEHFKI